jgi:hypothetical protein
VRSALDSAVGGIVSCALDPAVLSEPQPDASVPIAATRVSKRIPVGRHEGTCWFHFVGTKRILPFPTFQCNRVTDQSAQAHGQLPQLYAKLRFLGDHRQSVVAYGRVRRGRSSASATLPSPSMTSARGRAATRSPRLRQQRSASLPQWPTGAPVVCTTASHSLTTRPVVASSISAQRGTRRQPGPRRNTGIPVVPPEFRYSLASSYARDRPIRNSRSASP